MKFIAISGFAVVAFVAPAFVAAISTAPPGVGANRSRRADIPVRSSVQFPIAPALSSRPVSRMFASPTALTPGCKR